MTLSGIDNLIGVDNQVNDKGNCFKDHVLFD